MKELFFLAYAGFVLLFFFLGGLAFLLADLSGMFCYYKDGEIYLLRWERPVAKDTPQNRRKISRCMGCFVLALDFLIGCVWLGVAAQAL